MGYKGFIHGQCIFCQEDLSIGRVMDKQTCPKCKHEFVFGKAFKDYLHREFDNTEDITQGEI